MKTSTRQSIFTKLKNCVNPISVFYGFAKEQQTRPYVTYKEYNQRRRAENSRECFLDVNIWGDRGYELNTLAELIIASLHKTGEGFRVLFNSRTTLEEQENKVVREKVEFRVIEYNEERGE